jgi:hypothetical protein
MQAGGVVVIENASNSEDYDLILSALLQLLLDQSYRTIRGFCSLIMKEFGPYW